MIYFDIVMERAILSEVIASIERVKSIEVKTEIELSALRWELYASFQNILDSTAMVIAELGLNKPSSYGDLGRVLYNAKIITKEDEEAFKLVASTRNILAHAYRKLNLKDLNEVIKEVLPKVKQLIYTIEKILDNKKIDPKFSQILLFKRIKELKDIFEEHNVKLAYLFGSRARSMAREDSDYDIAVLYDKEDVTIMDEVKLAIDLANALNIPSDKIDVVSLKMAEPTLKARVLKEGICIYNKNEKIKKDWEKETYLEILHYADLSAVYMKRLLRKIVQ